MTSPALAMSRKLGRREIKPRLRIGDGLHLGDELVRVENPHLTELLERVNAFLAIGQQRLLGTFGRIGSHIARWFAVAQCASAAAASATETRIAIIRSSRGSRHRRQPRCVGSAEVLLQPGGLGTDLSRGDSQAPPLIAAPLAEALHLAAYYVALNAGSAVILIAIDQTRTNPAWPGCPQGSSSKWIRPDSLSSPAGRANR
jgi:hypothetical protein